MHELCPDSQLKDEECAKWIIEQSSKPECVNQGIWYFCANVAHSSRNLVRQALKNAEGFNKLVTKHLTDLRRGANSANEFESQS